MPAMMAVPWYQPQGLARAQSQPAIGGTKDRPDAFQDALAELQTLHERQVSLLGAEVARLHGELERHRLQADAKGKPSDGHGQFELTASLPAQSSTQRPDAACVPLPQPRQSAFALTKSLTTLALSVEPPPPPNQVGQVSAQIANWTSWASWTSRGRDVGLEDRCPNLVPGRPGDSRRGSRSCNSPTRSQPGRNSVSSPRSVAQVAARRASWVSKASNLRTEVHRANRTSSARLDESPGRVAQAYIRYSSAMGQQHAQRGWRGVFGRLVEKQSFNAAMVLVIMANTACIGFESSHIRAGDSTPPILHVLEHCFLGIYIVELGMRLAGSGVRRGLASSWIKFDLFLVICGIAEVVLVATKNTEPGLLEKVSIVRILRLARLARVLRLMIKFHALWLLVQGLLNSLSALVWTTAMVLTFLCVFAVLGLEVLQPDPAAGTDYNRVVNSHFQSLFVAMVTLLQGLTLDSFSTVYRPIVLARPVTIMYFAPFMLIVAIALMNLVTALMVNFSLDQAAKDKKEQEELNIERKATKVDLLKEMFHEIDEDGSGRLELEEMLNAPKELRALVFEIAELPHNPENETSTLMAIFDVMDFDCSGDVEVDEFCDGLLKLHDGNGLDTLRLTAQCQHLMRMLKGGGNGMTVAVSSGAPASSCRPSVVVDEGPRGGCRPPPDALEGVSPSSSCAVAKDERMCGPGEHTQDMMQRNWPDSSMDFAATNQKPHVSSDGSDALPGEETLCSASEGVHDAAQNASTLPGLSAKSGEEKPHVPKEASAQGPELQETQDWEAEPSRSEESWSVCTADDPALPQLSGGPLPSPALAADVRL